MFFVLMFCCLFVCFFFLQMWDNQSCSQEKLAVVNTFCWERKAVMKLPLGCVAQKPSLTQVLHDGSTAG